MVSTLVQDLRFAARGFARTPGIALLAIATLGVGVGANAAIFSVIHNVMIEPLPYPGAERVVMPLRTSASMGNLSVSPARTDLPKWRATPVFEAFTTYSQRSVVFTGGDEPEQLSATYVDTGFLDFTGAHPTLGRPFNESDIASAAAARVALLTDALWRRRFGAAPDVVGRRIELNDESYQVIGVLPSSFRMPLMKTDVLLPLPPEAPAKPGEQSFNILSAIGRLRAGVSVAAAQDQLTAAGIQPIGVAKDWRVRLRLPSESAGPAFRKSLLVLFGAVGCVLLIACANVANLVLARNASRERELAVRKALGAGRWRLARQLLTENLLLAAGGGVLGLLLAVWGIQAIGSLRPADMRELEGLRLNWEMLAFGFAATVLTGIAFGVYPALAGSRRDAAEALRQGTRAAGDTRGRLVRRALSVAEVALALVLLAGAGLLIRSYARLQHADLGFRTEGLIAANPGLPATRYPTPAARVAFLRQFAERVRALPSVRYADLASGIPPRGGLMFADLDIEGKTLSQADKPGGIGGGWVSAGYFEALGIRIHEGRGFTPDEIRTGANVTVINDQMAKRYWPGESAVGKRLRLGPSGSWKTVVGVVGSVKSDHQDVGGMQMYHPVVDADVFPDTALLVAATGDPLEVMAAVKAQAWSIDPKLPLNNVTTIESKVSETRARPWFNLVLLSIFASIGLLLAAIGIYGVISYSVGMRTREIGVRMALGATAADIRRAVLGEAVVLAGLGTAIGVAGALALGRFMKSMVFEVSASDPATLAAVASILSSAAVLAAWLPARRAMGTDPMVALRAD